MPEMLRTIIGDLLGQEGDLLVVGQSGNEHDAFRRALDEGADVLITNDQPDEGSACLDGILVANPISVLAISNDGRSADSIEFVRHPIALHGSSSLADAVRQIAEYRNGPATRRFRERSA